MPFYNLKGRADQGSLCSKNFDIIVESNHPLFETDRAPKTEAVKALHPDWTCIGIDSCRKL